QNSTCMVLPPNLCHRIKHLRLDCRAKQRNDIRKGANMIAVTDIPTGRRLRKITAPPVDGEKQFIAVKGSFNRRFHLVCKRHETLHEGRRQQIARFDLIARKNFEELFEPHILKPHPLSRHACMAERIEHALVAAKDRAACKALREMVARKKSAKNEIIVIPLVTPHPPLQRCLGKREGNAAHFPLHMIFKRSAIMRRQQAARTKGIEKTGRHIRRIAIAEMIENARRKRGRKIAAPAGERRGEQHPASRKRSEGAELHKAAHIPRGATEKAEDKPSRPERQHRQAARQRRAENTAALRLAFLDEGREFPLEESLEAFRRLRHRGLSPSAC